MASKGVKNDKTAVKFETEGEREKTQNLKKR